MAKKFTGQWGASPANINTDAPFDVRLVVSNLSDLLAAATFNKGLELYPGIVIAVVESGKEGIWTLPNEATLTSMRQTFAGSSYTPAEATEANVAALGWKKLAGDAELQSLLSNVSANYQTKSVSIAGITATTVEGALKELRDSTPTTEGIAGLTANVEEIQETLYGKEAEGEQEAVEGLVDIVSGNSADIEVLSGRVDAIANVGVSYELYSETSENSRPAEPVAGRVYLILPFGSAEGSDREEWMYVNDAWEQVGTTKADLTNYYTKGEIEDQYNGLDYRIDSNFQTIEQNKNDIRAASTLAQKGVDDAAEAKGIADGAAAQAGENKTAIEGLTTIVGATAEAGLQASVAKNASDISELSGKYTSLEGTVSSNKTATDEAIADVAGDLSDLTGTVNELSSTVTNNNTNLVAEIERVDGEIAKKADSTQVATDIGAAKTELQGNIDKKLDTDSFNTTIASYQTKATTEGDLANTDGYKTVEGALVTLKGAVATNATAIAGKADNATVTQLSTDLGSLTTRVTTAEGDIDAVEGRLDTAEGKIKTLEETTVPALEERVSTNETSIETLSDDLTSLSTEVGKKANANEVKFTYEFAGVQGLVVNEGTIGATLMSSAGSGGTGSVSMEGANVNISAKTEVGEGNVTVDSSKDITLNASNVKGTAVATSIDLTQTSGSTAKLTTQYAVANAINTAVAGVKSELSSALDYKGSYATYEALETARTEGSITPAAGDVYNVVAEYKQLDNTIVPAGSNYAWVADSESSGHWDVLGGAIDLSSYATTSYVDGKVTDINTAFDSKADKSQFFIDWDTAGNSTGSIKLENTSVPTLYRSDGDGNETTIKVGSKLGSEIDIIANGSSYNAGKVNISAASSDEESPSSINLNATSVNYNGTEVAKVDGSNIPTTAASTWRLKIGAITSDEVKTYQLKAKWNVAEGEEGYYQIEDKPAIETVDNVTTVGVATTEGYDYAATIVSGKTVYKTVARSGESRSLTLSGKSIIHIIGTGADGNNVDAVIEYNSSTEEAVIEYNKGSEASFTLSGSSSSLSINPGESGILEILVENFS